MYKQINLFIKNYLLYIPTRVVRTCFKLEAKLEINLKDSCYVTSNVCPHETTLMDFANNAICSETILKSTLHRNILTVHHVYVYSNKGVNELFKRS